MENFRALKMGTRCLDKATGLKGTITGYTIGMSRTIQYFLQPRGLDDEGQPVHHFYLPLERLEVKESDFEEFEVPFEILGSLVTDDATGFTGMAVHLVRHRNGCFHLLIQPKGVLKKTGKPIDAHDFDIRGCSGEKIPVLTAAENEETKQKNPGGPMGRALFERGLEG